ncbi:hypothetical protein L596_017957 [Steinernema carpocapsae]|uniref:Tyrosine-protein phosphatase domain-containing protein n=1 Tax=Steinernema carpocapsae TaxID=34508 RepID=A0A4V6A1V9_STECR|nr:hypothetical protein L596_017957 [Steinernema carpocapsae]
MSTSNATPLRTESAFSNDSGSEKTKSRRLPCKRDIDCLVWNTVFSHLRTKNRVDRSEVFFASSPLDIFKANVRRSQISRETMSGKRKSNGISPILRKPKQKLGDGLLTALQNSVKRIYMRQEPEIEDADDDKDEEKTVTVQVDCSDCRKKWASETTGRKVKFLRKEFEKLRRYDPEGKTTSAFEKNPEKNRYNDVVCMDSSRVVLKNRTSDYIHASWVTLPNNAKYICTQGPLEKTIEDFWLMTIQEKSKVVVMLCNLMEMGEEKCAQYWPLGKEETATYGIVKVKNCGTPPSGSDDIQYTVLEVEASLRRFFNTTFTVHHYRWTQWPDHLAPLSPAPIVDLLRLTKPKAANRPIVVHCSAGIGRTGTYVGIDYAFEKLKLNQEIKMTDILREIRGQRLKSVQSTLQYAYMHVCLLEYLALNKDVKRDSRFYAFMSDYRDFIGRYMKRQEKKKARESSKTVEEEEPPGSRVLQPSLYLVLSIKNCVNCPLLGCPPARVSTVLVLEQQRRNFCNVSNAFSLLLSKLPAV